ncbi:MAG: exosome complex RNA-binding protein Csl4 [Promethearchaeota archaeon]
MNMLSLKPIKSGDFVMIGDPLCIVEQYFGREGTFEEGGTVYAAVVGNVQINQQRRTIRVQNEKARNVLANRGDTVIGLVTTIRAYSVGLKLFKINDKIVYNHPYANVHVSKVSRRYLDKLSNAFVVGDVVRARVIGRTFLEYDLSTEDSNLGVIAAECSVCGHPLKRNKKGNLLKCDFCGNQEPRKVAFDYRKVREKTVFA